MTCLANTKFQRLCDVFLFNAVRNGFAHLYDTKVILLGQSKEHPTLVADFRGKRILIWELLQGTGFRMVPGSKLFASTVRRPCGAI